MQNVFLIGGGSIAPNPEDSETYALDLKILQSIPVKNRSKPISFIGAASGDSLACFETFKTYCSAICQKLNFPTVKFYFLEAKTPREDFARIIENSALVYLGGGGTKPLLAALENWQAEPVFKRALRSGTVFAGNSAGAFAFVAQSIYVGKANLEINDGLGLIPIILQAHATPETTKKVQDYLTKHPSDFPLVSIAEREMQGFSF